MFHFVHQHHCHLSDRELIIHVLENQKHIMSKISEFAEKQNAHNTAIDAAIDGLAEDNKALTELIATLQNSAGTISAEDQATLDALEARTATQAEKLAALDALTPPPVPPAA